MFAKNINYTDICALFAKLKTDREDIINDVHTLNYYIITH